MQPSSYVNWVASLNFDEAFVLLIAPIALVAGLGALFFRLMFGSYIGTASTVGTTKAGIAAEIYAVVLGFLVLFGFDHFNETRRAVILEASLVDRLRAEAEYVPAGAPDLVAAVDDYISTVLNEEWPHQVAGNAEFLITDGITALDRKVRNAVSGLDTLDAERMFKLVDEINEQRATRLSATPDSVVSSAIFQMLIVGLMLSVVTGWFVRGPSILIHMGLSTIVAGSIVMLMVLSAQLTYPFTGTVSIPKTAFSDLVRSGES